MARMYPRRLSPDTRSPAERQLYEAFRDKLEDDYIVFDDNQRIYVPHSQFPIQESPYLLTVNCRNTQRIHQVVVQFYQADTQPTAMGPHGRQVEQVPYHDLRHLWPKLQEVLLRLIENDPTSTVSHLRPSRR